MNSRLFLGSIYLLFLICVAECKDFNVMEHGAAADGVKDSTQAFLDTWKAACESVGPTTFLVPKGTFMVGIVRFPGPCKGAINFVLEGTVKADPNPDKFPNGTWVVFQGVPGLKVSGFGTFDGQGSGTWQKKNCKQDDRCNAIPINIRFNGCDNGFVTNITSLNSKLMHMTVHGCKNFTFQSVHITAPGNSINTDGIHIMDSSGVNIFDSIIATGDDCISVGPGSYDVKVIRVHCGPGHGISVGSLGKYPNEKPVSGITVRDCTITGTMWGVRIKTWPKSPPGTASNFIFENINMVNAGNPIYIDQAYCPWNKCTKDEPSKVKLSNIFLNKITGTSATKSVVNIMCSKSVPCSDVKIGDIDLKYTGKDGPGIATCTNAGKPTLTGVQNPKITIS